MMFIFKGNKELRLGDPFNNSFTISRVEFFISVYPVYWIVGDYDEKILMISIPMFYCNICYIFWNNFCFNRQDFDRNSFFPPF